MTNARVLQHERGVLADELAVLRRGLEDAKLQCEAQAFASRITTIVMRLSEIRVALALQAPSPSNTPGKVIPWPGSR